MERGKASPRRRATLKKKSRPKMQSSESGKAAAAQSRKEEIQEKRKDKKEGKRKSRRLMGLLPPANAKHDDQGKRAETETEAQVENDPEIQTQQDQDGEQQDLNQLPNRTPSPTSKHPHTLRERLHSLSETWDKARPYIERLNGTIVPLTHQGLEKEDRWAEEQKRRRSSGGRSSGGKSVVEVEKGGDVKG